MINCKCGGKPKYISSWGMDDQFVCDTCEYKTKNYYDGEEYAAQEWRKRNDPSYESPESKAMKSWREMLGRKRAQSTD